MDYQEAIYCMKVMADEEVCEECNYYQSCDHTKQADMAKIAISAMQELMKYKKIGTLEDLMKLKERELSGVELAKISCNLNHLEKYKQIGALEEVREAVEKQRKVKPEDGEYCPICHTFLKDEDDVPGFYCMNCGQAIDWGEKE